MIKVNVQKVKDTKLPTYAHDGDAGLDFYSAEDCVLKPMEEKPVSTGVRIAIPEGHVGLVWDRSGLAVKNSIHTMGGVIDSGYRGEVGIILKNLGKEDFLVEKGMKIAQMLIQPVVNAIIEEAESLPDSKRGEKGFGSTGV